MTKYEESFLGMIALLTMFGLTARHIHLIMLRYFAGFSLREIAESYKCSREYIRQEIDVSLKKMLRKKKLLATIE